MGQPPSGAGRTADTDLHPRRRLGPVLRVSPTGMRANRSSSSTGVSPYRRLIEASPTRGAEPGGTPDRLKLFGSHGQRPWLHEVVILRNGMVSHQRPEPD